MYVITPSIPNLWHKNLHIYHYTHFSNITIVREVMFHLETNIKQNKSTPYENIRA